MPTINIRWADNTAELRQRLKEGIGTIDAMKASVDKTVQSLGGQGLFKAANQVTAAIIEMGGATKLTAAEQQRANALLDKAIEKYKLMGQVVPPAMQKIADATRQAGDATGFLEKHAVGATDFMKKYAVAAEPAVASTTKFANVAALATGALGALGIGLTVGAAVSFGKDILADADALTKMHDKTGISVEGLQKFQIAADDAGNTLEQLTMATNQMQNRLAGNDKSAVAAIEKLGLSLSELKSLSPEQQFMTIADAIRQIKDPAEQVNIAMDLFGRQGAEILPTIKRGFDDLKDASVGMSKEAVKGLDDFGDAMKRWERAGKASVGEFLGFALPGLERAAKLLATMAGIRPVQLFTPPTPPKPGETERTPLSFASPLEAAQFFAPEKSTGANVKTLGIPENIDDITRSLNSEREALNAINEPARKAAEEHRKLMEKIEATRKALKDIQIQQGTLFGVPETASLATFHKGLIDFSNLLPSKTLGGGLNSIVPGQFAKSMTDQLRPGVLSGFSDLFKTAIPQSLLAAFQGGGSPVKSIGSLLGAQLGTNLATTFGSTLKDKLGKVIGAGLNGLLPGIGSLIGPGLSALVGGIKRLFGGPSAAELKGRQESADFQAVIAASLTAQQKIQAGGVAWKMTMIGVRDAYLATGRTAEEAARITAMLFDTKNPNAYKRAIEEIQDVLNEQKQDQQDLQAAIQRYGFTLEQLGPAMRKQQLDEQAKTLLNDWRLLVGSGINLTTVNEKMASSVNDYLQAAKRTGTEVPAAMRPILQSMIDQGTLVDENGNKITDLSAVGVSFAETMTAGFDRVVAKLNQLLQGLGLIPAAVEAIPTDRTIDIRANFIGFEGNKVGTPTNEPATSFASTGGLVTRSGVRYFSGGGIVRWLPPPQYFAAGGFATMSSLFPSRGTDTVRAMVTPGEEIVTEDGRSLVKSALAALSAAVHDSGSKQPVILNMYLDTREVGTAIMDWQSNQVARGTTEGTRFQQAVIQPVDRPRGPV